MDVGDFVAPSHREIHVALLTIKNVGVLSGVAPTYATVNASDTVVGGQGVFIHVKNANAGSVNVTIATPETVDGDLTVQDRIVAVAAGTEVMIPVPSRYNDRTTGVATVTCSPTSSVTIGAFRGPVQA
jgi:hypothetical protein